MRTPASPPSGGARHHAATRILLQCISRAISRGAADNPDPSSQVCSELTVRSRDARRAAVVRLAGCSRPPWHSCRGLS